MQSRQKVRQILLPYLAGAFTFCILFYFLSLLGSKLLNNDIPQICSRGEEAIVRAANDEFSFYCRFCPLSYKISSNHPSRIKSDDHLRRAIAMHNVDAAITGCMSILRSKLVGECWIGLHLSLEMDENETLSVNCAENFEFLCDALEMESKGKEKMIENEPFFIDGGQEKIFDKNETDDQFS